MPIFVTRLINSVLDCQDEGVEYATAAEAADKAVYAALDIAKELLKLGERVAHIEIEISDGTGVVRERRLLTVSIAAPEP